MDGQRRRQISSTGGLQYPRKRPAVSSRKVSAPGFFLEIPIPVVFECVSTGLSPKCQSFFQAMG